MLESIKLWQSGDGATAELEEGNPYLEERYASQQTYLDLAKSRRNWQIAAAWSTTFLTIFAIAFIVLAFTAPFQLWVAEVDTVGNVLSLEPVSEVKDAPPNAMRGVLGSFIVDVRAVYEDPHARANAVNEAYAYTTSDTKTWLNTYYKKPENDPRNLAEKFSRTAVLRSITRIPETTNQYEIQWTETKHYGGGREETSLWKAYVTTTRSAPTTSEEAATNPYGILISDISWSRITTVP